MSPVPTVRVAVRARFLGRHVYVRREDLLQWFDTEARALREVHRDEVAAHVESLARDLRKVSAE